MNTKIYKTPYETTGMRAPNKVPRTLVFLALCTIGFPLWAQPGQTCSNPMNLGTLRDTVMTLTLSYPQTDLWLRFSTNQPRPFLGVGGTGAQQVKWQQANVYSTCAQNLTNLPPNPAPGRTGMSLTPTLTSPGTYLLHLKRFYTTSRAGADTGVSTFRLGMAQSLQANCPGPFVQSCGNLAQNGEMETFDASSAFAFDLNSFYTLCRWERGFSPMAPVYFNTNPPSGASLTYSLPIINLNGLLYPGLTGNSSNPAMQGTSNGIIGIETAVGNSDIVRLPISGLNNQLFFVSYDVTAGRNYGVYNNRVDLDVSTAATYNALNYPSASYNPTIVSGTVTNGIPSNQWTTKSCVFQGNPNLQNIFIGNLGQQPYSPQQSGIPGQDCNFVFIDNVILKPFTVQLPSAGTSVCQGQAVSVNLPCEYIFPGAVYTWRRLNSLDTLSQNNNGSLTYFPIGADSLVLTIRLSGQEIGDTLIIEVLPTPSGIISLQHTNSGGGGYCRQGQKVWVGPSSSSGLFATAAQADAFAWYWDGQPLASANSETIFLSGMLTVGQHTLSLRRTLDHTELYCHRQDSLVFWVLSDDALMPCLPGPLTQAFETDTTNMLYVGAVYDGQNRLTVAPNPSPGMVQVGLEGTEGQVLWVRDVVGRLVYTQRLQPGTQSLDLRHLGAGVFEYGLQGLPTQGKLVLAP